MQSCGAHCSARWPSDIPAEDLEERREGDRQIEMGHRVKEEGEERAPPHPRVMLVTPVVNTKHLAKVARWEQQ